MRWPPPRGLSTLQNQKCRGYGAACGSSRDGLTPWLDKLHVVAADLARARLTVQHAHMYHKQVLNTTDRVRSKKFNMTSMISPMNLVEMDEDRRGAQNTDRKSQSDERTEGVKESIVRWNLVATCQAAYGLTKSQRAQACLNESLRLLDKHNAMLPQDIAAQVTRVRELGVSQIVKMYNMLHGTSSDVAQQMDVLSQRQEEAFACLTKIAVGHEMSRRIWLTALIGLAAEYCASVRKS